MKSCSPFGAVYRLTIVMCIKRNCFGGPRNFYFTKNSRRRALGERMQQLYIADVVFLHEFHYASSIAGNIAFIVCYIGYRQKGNILLQPAVFGSSSYFSYCKNFSRLGRTVGNSK